MSPFISSTVYFCLLTNQSCQEFVYLFTFGGNSQFFILLIRWSAHSGHRSSNPQKLHLNPLKIPLVAAQHIQAPTPLEPASVSCSTPPPALRPPVTFLSSPQRQAAASVSLRSSSFFLLFPLIAVQNPSSSFHLLWGFPRSFPPSSPCGHHLLLCVCFCRTHSYGFHCASCFGWACPWSLRAVQSMVDFCISGTFSWCLLSLVTSVWKGHTKIRVKVTLCLFLLF